MTGAPNMNLSEPITSVVTTLEGQAFRVLAHTTEPLTGSAIARLSGSGSTVGMRLALARLVENGVVDVRKVGPSLVYTANRDHVMWPVIEALVSSADSAMERLQAAVVNSLEMQDSDSISVRDISLAFFGSVARGESTAASDVDVLMILPSMTIDEVTAPLVDIVSSTIARATGNVCNVYCLTREQLTELIARNDAMIASWLADARTFNGSDVKRLIRTLSSARTGDRL